MFKTIVAILLLAAVANSQLVGWRNCGSPLATVHRIRVSGCTHTPCHVLLGQVVRIGVDVTALANSINLPFVMSATAFGIPLPIRLLEGNACQHLTHGQCPALNGNTFTFEIDYLVTNIVPPGVPIVITSTLWNDFGDVGICIQVDALLVASTNEISAE